MITWGAKVVLVPEAFGAQRLHSCDHFFCAEMPWGLVSFGAFVTRLTRPVQQVVATRSSFFFLVDDQVKELRVKKERREESIRERESLRSLREPSFKEYGSWK